MNQNFDPSVERLSPELETLATHNVRTLSSMARGGYFFTTFWLHKPGDAQEPLDHDCDPDNRRMLDKVYLLARVDKNAGKTTETTNDRWYERRTRYRSGHDIEIDEVYHRRSDGEDFWVVAVPIGEASARTNEMIQRIFEPNQTED